MKTYEGKTLKELKDEYPGIRFRYCRYAGFGDFGIEASYNEEELFFSDDLPLMDRHIKAATTAFTGIVSNYDYSCELFIDGESLGKTTKHRARKYLALREQGTYINIGYLSSIRNYLAFTDDASEDDKKKTTINRLAHELIPDSGQNGHEKRNAFRRLAYSIGVDAAVRYYDYGKK